MSGKNTREEKLKIIFATYPQEDTVYMTSDEKAFFNEGQANAHAQRLQDGTVSKYPNKFAAKAIEILDEDQEASDKSQETAPENQENAAQEDLAQEDANPEDERAVLAARFEELAGRKPAVNIKLENLRKAVEELEQANN